MRRFGQLGFFLATLAMLTTLPARAGAIPDQILQKAFIPSARRVHGEVRLVRREEDTMVVQTLLYSTALRRGIRNMEKKEREAWPPSSPFHESSQAYIADLRAGLSRSIEQLEGGNQTDRRLKLLIELVSSPSRHEYTISVMEISGKGDEIQITSRVPIVTREAPAEYIEAQMRAMLETAFGEVPDTLLPHD